jgi:plasmid stability protein
MVAVVDIRNAAMPSLTIKDIPPPLMERLRASAARDHRSLNREAIFLLERALGTEDAPASALQQERDAQLAVWEDLAGRWVGDEREIDAMIEEIYHARSDGREVAL